MELKSLDTFTNEPSLPSLIFCDRVSHRTLAVGHRSRNLSVSSHYARLLDTHNLPGFFHMGTRDQTQVLTLAWQPL